MVKICVYTAITGGYDRIREPEFITPGIDYFCFSDRMILSQTWKQLAIPHDLDGLSDVKKQRLLKVCPHRYLPVGYDISIWIDGNIVVTGDMNELVQEYDLDEIPLYTRIHPGRDCIYDEAKAVVKFGKATKESVAPIIERYRQVGYPEHIGLAETCVLLRRHNDPKCVMVNDAWAVEILLHSHRDQLSFNYVCWKNHFLPGYMTKQFKINQNKYFRLEKHG